MKPSWFAAALGLIIGGFLPEAHSAIDPAKEAVAIDQLVDAKLKAEGIKANAAIDDATFVRRVYLGIIGRIPTIEEAEAFHADSSPQRRATLIDHLLASDGYVSHSYHFWADLLRINQNLGNSGPEAETAYQLWVKDAIRANLPYDEMVRKLVTAQGLLWENGAVGYYQRDRGMPLDNMSNTVRIFLGTRMECAQCHNHPFDKWTQMDFFQMAAFSYGMTAADYQNPNRAALQPQVREERIEAFRSAVGVENFPVVNREEDIDRIIAKEKDRGRFEIQLARFDMTEAQFRETAGRGVAAVRALEQKVQPLKDAESELYRPIRYISAEERPRDLRLPHDYQYPDAKPLGKVTAKPMFGDEFGLPTAGPGMIDAYASWLTSKANPTFTRVIANRIWKTVFGIGVFEPVDEVTDHMVVTNPELMTQLEDLMRRVNYDLKEFQRVLYNTQAYQRAVDANEVVMGAPYYFQGPLLRRMAAEQIWDSIVGLAIPQADDYRPRLKNQLASIERVRLIYESLAQRSEEEYIALVNEISEAIVDFRPKQDEFRQAFVAARAAKDDAAIRKARTELSAVEREINGAIARIGYTRLKEKTEPEELLAALGMSEQMAGQSMGTAESENIVITSLPKPQFPRAPAGLDAAAERKWRSRMKGELQSYNSLVAGMARASEIASPAPRGHFMREFGQSDREVIENSNSAASVPQALNLLNGPIVEALVNPFAVFGRRLAAAQTPEQTAELIFQAMLTRQPTPPEIAMVKAELEQNPRDGAEGVVWALLNTRQFLFVR